MREDFLDYEGIFAGGYDLHGTLAKTTGVHVDIEYALKQPGRSGMRSLEKNLPKEIHQIIRVSAVIFWELRITGSTNTMNTCFLRISH